MLMLTSATIPTCSYANRRHNLRLTRNQPQLCVPQLHIQFSCSQPTASCFPLNTYIRLHTSSWTSFPVRNHVHLICLYPFWKKASWLQKIQAESGNFFPELYFPRPFCFCRCSHKPPTGAAAQTLVNLLTPQGKYRLYRTPFKSPQLKFYTFRQKSDSMFHNPSHMLLLQLPATDVWFGKRSVSSVADQYI